MAPSMRRLLLGRRRMLQAAPAFAALPACGALDDDGRRPEQPMVEIARDAVAKFGQRIASLRQSRPYAFAWSPDGLNLVVFSAMPTTLTLWRPGEDKVLWTIPYSGFPPDRPIAFTGDGRYIVAWGSDGKDTSLTVLDPETGRIVHNIPSPQGHEHGGGTNCVAASSDGERIAFRSARLQPEGGWTLHIYSTNRWEQIAEYHGDWREGAARLAFTPDNLRIVVASMQLPKVIDRNELNPWSITVRVHDANSGSIISANSEPTMSQLNRISISPDGLFLAVAVESATFNAGEDWSKNLRDTLVIYSLHGCKQIRAYPRLSHITWDVSWNPHFPLILAQDTNKLALWDSRSDALCDLIENDDSVTAKFRPDGRAVAYIDSGRVVVREIKVK